jgi:hypothetical protein
MPEEARKEMITIETFEQLKSCLENPGSLDPNEFDFVQRIKVKDVKKGEFFVLKLNAKKVYQRGDYCRLDRGYDCSEFNGGLDINIKSNRYVYTGFTF